MPTINLKQIKISNWKQFQSIEIDFHPRLTVLTGANGSGKTTILNLLAQHFNWNVQELSTPARNEKTGQFQFFPRFFKNPCETDSSKIGELLYNNNVQSSIEIENNDSVNYTPKILNRQPVPGFNIPFHRPVFNYVGITELSFQKREKQQAFRLVNDNQGFQI